MIRYMNVIYQAMGRLKSIKMFNERTWNNYLSVFRNVTPLYDCLNTSSYRMQWLIFHSIPIVNQLQPVVI